MGLSVDSKPDRPTGNPDSNRDSRVTTALVAVQG